MLSAETDRRDSAAHTGWRSAEIVKLLKAGSAFYAPSASITQMVDSIVYGPEADRYRARSYLDGEFGIKGLFVGVPVKLGSKGIEEIVQLQLTEEEQAGLNGSAEAVQQLVDTMRSQDPDL